MSSHLRLEQAIIRLYNHYDLLFADITESSSVMDDLSECESLDGCISKAAVLCCCETKSTVVGKAASRATEIIPPCYIVLF